MLDTPGPQHWFVQYLCQGPEASQHPGDGGGPREGQGQDSGHGLRQVIFNA